MPVQLLPVFELEETTIASLQSGLTSGKFTARGLTERYFTRIEAIDKHGPAVNAVIEINPDALPIADRLDKERLSKGPRSALHGIPVLIKDNIGTSDRMMTTAGSLALKGSAPAQDAFVVRRLREAGAVLLGKTNLSEWANIRHGGGRSIGGWSGRGGLTRNPYALDRSAGGSSSGSAVAVSTNECVVAIGTETIGSIIGPSSANGIVGIKPTVGLVSRSGIIPVTHSYDTAGPMARTVADAAALLSVLAGFDPQDQPTTPLRTKSVPDYTQFLDPAGLRGARIGVLRQNFGFSDHADRLMEDAIREMKRQGAVLVDPLEVPNTGFGDSIQEVLLTELKADLNRYLEALGPNAPVKSLKDVIEFNEGHRREEMPYFGQVFFEKAEQKGPLTDKKYLEALEKTRKLSRDEGIDAAMDKHQLDALIGPSGGPASPTDLVNGDRGNQASSILPAVAGYPHITVPAGFAFGLPVGISFFGRAWSEPVLLKLAYSFEQATRQRKPPRFLPTADLAV
jgi:amidase